jgi:ABC-type uncharacterized transport system substrate-binding protein
MGASLGDAWIVAGILRSPVTLRNRIRRTFSGVESGSASFPQLVACGASTLRRLQYRNQAGQRVQLLKEVIPQLSRLAVLGNPTHPAYASQVKTIETGVRALGGQVELIAVRSPSDFEAAFKIARAAQALLQIDDTLFTTHRTRLLELTAQNRLPAIYGVGEFVDGGGLMAYGPSFPEMYRRAATFVDKVLKGANPGDLPIEQPRKFELVINLKTAKALGLTIPRSLLLRADQVIE